jgi:hypothetical protein
MAVFIICGNVTDGAHGLTVTVRRMCGYGTTALRMTSFGMTIGLRRKCE